MITYGLIGYPLSHSLSQVYFTEKFREEKIYGEQYTLFPLEEIRDFKGFLHDHPDLSGLNVTIPFKEKIMPFMDWLDPVSKKTGAVNTISILRKNGSIFLRGYNTDAGGFRASLVPGKHKNALILGTGGAAKAAAYVLGELGIRYLFVSRTVTGEKIIRYSGLSKKIIQEHTLIINATPLGMFPDVSSYPLIPYEYLSKKHFLYDLVYNPGMTEFLVKGKERGTKIQNGSQMLHHQAELSYKIWKLKDPGGHTEKETL
jgi:shikimate dehydrogenase